MEKLLLEKQAATGLFAGLLAALSNWTKKQAYGAATPDELKKIREEKGLTQVRAAELLGITHRQYHRHEAGDAPISEERLRRLKDISQSKKSP